MPAIEVSAGLVFHAGKLLIARRFDDAHLGGFWEFPGGKREPDESFEDCLRRELKEELDIEVRVLDLVESLTHSYPSKTVHLKFFRCEWLAGEPRAIGCSEFAWVERGNLRSFAFPAADSQLLDRLLAEVELWRSVGEPRI